MTEQTSQQQPEPMQKNDPALNSEVKTPGGQFASTLTPEALALRQYQAYKMRLAGASYDDIGRTLKISRKTASRDCAAVHAELKADIVEDIDTIRAQQLARLDIALFAIMPDVKKGRLLAVDRLLAIEDRRSKLLGLDAAKKLELTGKDGGAIETQSQVNIRERLTPEEAAQKTDEIVRRLEIARRETRRLAAGGSVELHSAEVKALPQTEDERN